METKEILSAINEIKTASADRLEAIDSAQREMAQRMASLEQENIGGPFGGADGGSTP